MPRRTDTKENTKQLIIYEQSSLSKWSVTKPTSPNPNGNPESAPAGESTSDTVSQPTSTFTIGWELLLSN